MSQLINNELLNELTNMVINTENIQGFLDIVANCPHLSCTNQLLAYKQYPKCSLIMGKVAWENVGANIIPGSKPIALLYPHITLTDPGVPLTDKDGDELEEIDTRSSLYVKDPNYAANYKTVYAFDIRQTNRHITETPPCEIEFIDRIKMVSPLTVSFITKNELIFPRDKGQYVESEKEIQILQGLSPSDANYVAALMYVEYHIDNAILSSHNKLGVEFQFLEMIKMLCAYCVTKHFNLSNKQHSFIYINKLSTKDISIKKKILSLVSNYVNEIIQQLEGWSLTFNETAIINSILFSESYSELTETLTRVGEKISRDKSLFSSLCSITHKLLHSEAGYLTQLYVEKTNQTLYSYPPYPVNIDAQYFESIKQGE